MRVQLGFRSGENEEEERRGEGGRGKRASRRVFVLGGCTFSEEARFLCEVGRGRRRFMWCSMVLSPSNRR